MYVLSPRSPCSFYPFSSFFPFSQSGSFFLTRVAGGRNTNLDPEPIQPSRRLQVAEGGSVAQLESPRHGQESRRASVEGCRARQTRIRTRQHLESRRCRGGVRRFLL